MLRRICSERSQSLVEFSLVVPILMLLALGIVDFGMAFKSYVELTNASREGARYAVVGNPAGVWPTDCTVIYKGNVVNRVCQAAAGMDLTAECGTTPCVSVTYPNGHTSGKSVVVTAEYRYNLITPLSGIMTLVSGGSFDGYFDLSSSSDMRLE
jgi:Flp pilus assembly protein TadG